MSWAGNDASIRASLKATKIIAQGEREKRASPWEQISMEPLAEGERRLQVVRPIRVVRLARSTQAIFFVAFSDGKRTDTRPIFAFEADHLAK